MQSCLAVVSCSRVVQSCRGFTQIFLNVFDKYATTIATTITFDKYAPLQQQLLRVNYSTYIPKPLRKAVMRRSYLGKVYCNGKSDKSLKTDKKQKKFSCRLYNKERKHFFSNLNPSYVTANKLFWKIVKAFFSNKVNYGSQIKLVENDEFLQGNECCFYIKYHRKHFYHQ